MSDNEAVGRRIAAVMERGAIRDEAWRRASNRAAHDRTEEGDKRRDAAFEDAQVVCEALTAQLY